MKLKTKIKKQSKLIIKILVILVVVAGIVFVYRHNHQKPSGTTAGTNLTPATAEEKQAAEAHKDQIANQQSNPDQSSPATKTVPVVITEATKTGVKGYVQGIFEEGGTCTATATQGSQTITKTSTGFGNVSYTQCAPINWDNPLGSGSWTITLTYKSANGQGTASKALEVN